MPADTRAKGYRDDIARRDLLADMARIEALLSTGDLRILHRAALTMERLKSDPIAEIGRNALAVALIDAAVELAYEDREQAEQHERERAVFLGDTTGEVRIATPTDSDAPAATYGAPVERGGG